MLKRIWANKFFRFLTVGSCNSICDISLLNGLVFWLLLAPLLANVAAISVSVCLSYFLNRRFVFAPSKPNSWRIFWHFIAVTGFSILVIQTIVLYLSSHLLLGNAAFVASIAKIIPVVHIPANAIALNLSKIMAIIAGMGWNYMIYSRVIFKYSAASVAEPIGLSASE